MAALINPELNIDMANQIRRRRRGALSLDDIEGLAEANYLDKVVVIMPNGEEKDLNSEHSIRDQILNPDVMNLTDTENKINDIIEQVTSRKEDGIDDESAEWIYCEKACVKGILPEIKREVASTAFMLRVLANSVIDTTEGEETEPDSEELESVTNIQIGGNNSKGRLPLKFRYDNPNNERLTSVWDNDKKFFKLEQLDPESQSSRLIMGLGPSAAGKTFWARHVIKLMRKTDPQFPRSFLSVDGGLVRELSFVYQDIIKALSKHPKINGLNNLVSSGWDPFHKSLFKAGHVKKDIKEYLESQKSVSGNLPVSVYVPETLGSPLSDGFKKGVEKYVHITGDNNWIGLYIWQGRTPEEDAVWVKKFKKANPQLDSENIDAKSTTESGKGRELTEGKKYSSSAYSYSKKHGYKAIKQAPGARIDIHNSGGKQNVEGIFNKSVVIEYPNANREYLLTQDMLNEFNAIYLQKAENLIGQIGGKKTRRRRRKSRRQTKKKRKNRKRKTRKHKGRKKRSTRKRNTRKRKSMKNSRKHKKGGDDAEYKINDMVKFQFYLMSRPKLTKRERTGTIAKITSDKEGYKYYIKLSESNPKLWGPVKESQIIEKIN